TSRASPRFRMRSRRGEWKRWKRRPQVCHARPRCTSVTATGSPRCSSGRRGTRTGTSMASFSPCWRSPPSARCRSNAPPPRSTCRSSRRRATWTCCWASSTWGPRRSRLPRRWRREFGRRCPTWRLSDSFLARIAGWSREAAAPPSPSCARSRKGRPSSGGSFVDCAVDHGLRLPPSGSRAHRDLRVRPGPVLVLPEPAPVEPHEPAVYLRWRRELRAVGGRSGVLERSHEQRDLPSGNGPDEHGPWTGAGPPRPPHRSSSRILAIRLLSPRRLDLHRDGDRVAVDLSPVDRAAESRPGCGRAAGDALARRPALLAVVAHHHRKLAGRRLQHGPLPGRARDHSHRDARRRRRRRGGRRPAGSLRGGAHALPHHPPRGDHPGHPGVPDRPPREGADRGRTRAQHRSPRLRHLAASLPVLRHRFRLCAGVRAFRDAPRLHGAPDATLRLAGALPVRADSHGRARRFLGAAPRSLVLGIGAVVILTPFLWMLVTSFKAPQDIFTAEFRLLPAHPTLQNYVSVWHRAPMPRYLVNSFV